MRFFRGLGLFIAIACLVWVGVLWHWQATHRDMSVDDILIYLGALPVALFVLVLLGGWAGRGAWARANAKTVPKVTPPTDGATTKAGGARPLAEEAARHATLQLLAAYAVTPAGASIDELLDATEAGAPRPDLHESLRDAHGLPVMAAQVKDLDLDDMAAALDALADELAQSKPGRSRCEHGQQLQRALALLAEPLAGTVSALAAWPERLRQPEREAGKPQPARRHHVHVLSAWPASLTGTEIELAQAWLASQLRVLGEGLVDPLTWQIRPGKAASGPELWLEAELLFSLMQREGLDDPLLLLACHSDIAEATVQQLEDAGQLFGAARPKGVIPGEAAATLLLAGPHWPPAKEDAPPQPQLHRASVARRDKPVDAAGRVSADLAIELLRQALQAACLAPEAIAGLADDADQHSARASELYGAMLAQLPHLDASEDHRMAGHLLGRAGAAGTLVAVAMAAQRAAATKKPWAALAVGDAHWRLALVARPEAPPPPEELTKSQPTAEGNKSLT